jgi:molybdopterin adenylyltransferase
VSGYRAAVLTVSDGVTHGTRQDRSGDALDQLLTDAGYRVVRRVTADERPEIEQALRQLAATNDLVVTTGGTGFGPRDVTPEATKAVVDREAPGLVHQMLAVGIEKTPTAALSRPVAGSLRSTLIVNLPGSTTGAVENLSALLSVLPHALELLAGHTEH